MLLAPGRPCQVLLPVLLGRTGDGFRLGDPNSESLRNPGETPRERSVAFLSGRASARGIASKSFNGSTFHLATCTRRARVRALLGDRRRTGANTSLRSPPYGQ